MALAVIVKLTITGDSETAQTIVDKLKVASRREEGCVYYSFNASAGDNPDYRNDKFFVEKWRDKQALSAHNNSDHFKELVPQLLESATIHSLRTAHFVLEGSRSSSHSSNLADEMVRLIVNVRVTNKAEFDEISVKLVEASNQEEGCIEYSLAKYDDYDDEYVYIELWRDEKCLAEHSSSEHCQLLLPRLIYI